MGNTNESKNWNVEGNYAGSKVNKYREHDASIRVNYDNQENLKGYGAYRYQGNSCGNSRHDYSVGFTYSF